MVAIARPEKAALESPTEEWAKDRARSMKITSRPICCPLYLLHQAAYNPAYLEANPCLKPFSIYPPY